MVGATCLCGDIAWEAEALRSGGSHCHCSMCRKAHGTAFASWAPVASQAFRWLRGGDSLHRFESSPGGFRNFCGRCGSSLPVGPTGESVWIPLGPLEGGLDLRPDSHIFVGSRAVWFTITDDRPQHAELPAGWETPKLAERRRSEAPAGSVGGSCLCGGVAFHVEGRIDLVHNCHCLRCRRARSALHATNGFVDTARLRYVRGEDRLESYKLPEAERFRQTFCRTCGSPMPRPAPARPYAVIPMGCVDDDPGGRPNAHIFVGSKASWFEITDALPQYEAYTPQA